MNFHFINPGILWGLGACAIPIIIHLFFKKRSQHLRWAAMKFLVVAYRKTKTSLLLENIILLLLRIMAIALLAMIFARPAAPDVAKLTLFREPDHYIVLIDTSYSMGFCEGDETSFKKAKDQLRVLLENTKQGDFVTMIAINEYPTIIMSSEIPLKKDEKDKLFQKLDQIELSEMTMDLGVMIEAIKEQIAAKSVNKCLVVISDFQRVTWEKPLKNASFLKELQTIRNQLKSFIIVDISPRRSDNLTITDLELDGVVGVGIPARFVATIRNFGKENYNNVEVMFYPQPKEKYLVSIEMDYEGELNKGNNVTENLRNRLISENISISSHAILKVKKTKKNSREWLIEDREKKQQYLLRKHANIIKIYIFPDSQSQEGKQSQYISIAPHGEQKVVFFHTFDSEEWGSRYIRVELQIDALRADNRRYLTFDVLEKIRVLVVDGDPKLEKFESECDYLLAALGSSPVTPTQPAIVGNLPVSLIQAEKVEIGGLSQIRFQEYDVIVLANVQTFTSKSQVEELENFVKQGGGVFIWLGNKVLVDYYNQEIFKDGMGFFPARIMGTPIGTSASQYLEETAFNFQGLARQHEIWRYFVSNQQLTEILENTLIYRFFPLEVDAHDKSVTVLASYNDPQQHPALVLRKFGKGKVLLSTTTADAAWNSFHSDQSGHVFVTMIHEFIQYLGAQPNLEKNIKIRGSISRRYDYPVEEAWLISPDYVFKPMAVSHTDEYIFSLSNQTDSQELAIGFYKLGIALEGEITIVQNSPRKWTISTTEGQKFHIDYDEGKKNIDIYKQGNLNEQTKLPVNLKAKSENDKLRPASLPVIKIYCLDKKNYTIESQSTDTIKSGIYALTLNSFSDIEQLNQSEQEYVAVNVNPIEGNAVPVSEQEIVDMLAPIKEIKYTRDLRKSQELQKFQRHTEYWHQLLFILFAIMATESFISMWFARRTK